MLIVSLITAFKLFESAAFNGYHAGTVYTSSSILICRSDLRCLLR